jgi:hypothetical protein
MVAPVQVVPKQLPNDLREAIEAGVLTREQLEDLIAFEAAELGLTFADAVDKARRDELPKSIAGADLRLLVSMLLS